MAVADQIAEILARADLTDDEKRTQISAVKASAIYGMIVGGGQGTQPFVGRSFKVQWQQQQLTVHVLQCSIRGDRLFVEVELTKGGETRVVQYFVVNPPVNADGAENLAAAAAEMLASLTDGW